MCFNDTKIVFTCSQYCSATSSSYYSCTLRVEGQKYRLVYWSVRFLSTQESPARSNFSLHPSGVRNTGARAIANTPLCCAACIGVEPHIANSQHPRHQPSLPSCRVSFSVMHCVTAEKQASTCPRIRETRALLRQVGAKAQQRHVRLTLMQ